MIRINPVGDVPPAGEQPAPHTGHRGAHGSPRPEADSFHASLLGQHAQQLDPDDHTAADSDVAQLAEELAHLLQMLEERLASMQQRALLSAGHGQHGLLQELWQIDDVLQRLRPLWAHPLLVALRTAALPRLRGIFAHCRFVLQAVVHAGEPHDWQALRQALLQREAELG